MQREAKAPAEKRAWIRLKKKPYLPPKLTVHGDVEEITNFNGGAATDGYSGSALEPT